MALTKQKDPAAFRRTILRKAAELIREQGVHGLSMRKLSHALGASTMVLYTHFRNKQDLLNELYLEGFDRLRRHLEEVPEGEDPLAYVVELGRAYRRAALANPDAYELMQSRTLQGFSLPKESLEKSALSFRVLEGAVRQCMDRGLIAPGCSREVAQMLWGSIHGLISLQLAGHFVSEEAATARFEMVLKTLEFGLMAGAHAREVEE
ncbi:TetR/AcrR family transcriptional regulator [Sulfidibacter corallicola]|uniref:TetR/AcrR family transcriptional regulator n=1 Tax=Sulfidibacter corallicola TaxID=2818388 RepID=A0A8A4TNW8_SULCO|nr:TetR/AcrR family transcriptional regulator [Sulfidibacter corallicola]QTD50591.1 TetR/AcrR family transcriptional regulator [Sulfidibacter corallicola]